jgi:hypothetical protein
MYAAQCSVTDIIPWPLLQCILHSLPPPSRLQPPQPSLPRLVARGAPLYHQFGRGCLKALASLDKRTLVDQKAAEVLFNQAGVGVNVGTEAKTKVQMENGLDDLEACVPPLPEHFKFELHAQSQSQSVLLQI